MLQQVYGRTLQNHQTDTNRMDSDTVCNITAKGWQQLWTFCSHGNSFSSAPLRFLQQQWPQPFTTIHILYTVVNKLEKHKPFYGLLNSQFSEGKIYPQITTHIFRHNTRLVLSGLGHVSYTHDSIQWKLFALHFYIFSVC